MGLVATLLLLSLCSCSTSSTTPSATVDGPYASDIAQAQSQATSDFERQAFADGKISRDEYDQANSIIVRCMRDLGWDTVAEPDGISGFDHYRTTTQDNPNTSEVEGKEPGPDLDSCTAKTGRVTMLYREMTRNPRKLDEDQIVLDCFRRKGLVPASFTVKDLLAARARPGTGTVFDSEDPNVSGCIANPSLA